MKYFLRDISYCTAIFCCICLCMEFIIQNVENDYSYKYKYLNNHKNDIEVLILGNSYAEDGINPHLLSDNAFNAAISARWIYYDKLIIEKYVPKMPNIKTVIFTMGYKMPFVSSYHYKNKYTSTIIIYRYAKFMHLFYDKFPKNYLYWFAIPRGNMNINEFFSSRICDDVGYCLLNGTDSNLGAVQNVDPDVIVVENVDKQVAEYTMYLNAMAKVCYENDVRFIVVTPPCHDSFNQNTRPEGIATIHKIIDDVRKEYPIEYIDYLQDEQFRSDSIYYNCSHLNSIGADMFAKRIKSDFNL